LAPRNIRTKWLIAGLLGLAVFVIIFIGFKGWYGALLSRPSQVQSRIPRDTVSAESPLQPRYSKAEPLDVCGFGTVKVRSTDHTVVHQFLGEMTEEASSRWRSNLLNSTDNRARGVGLLLKDRASGDGEIAMPSKESQESLVKLAETSADPAVYAIAVRACNAYTGEDLGGFCQKLSLATWARLDSDNAIPWMLLGNQARSRGDQDAEAAAFMEAAKATRVDSYGDSLFGFAQTEIPADATPLERSFVAEDLLDYEAAWPEPQYDSFAQDYCMTSSLPDPGARQTCDALAQLLVSKGTKISDIWLGMKLGSRVGWSPARIEDLDREIRALSISHPLIDEYWDCFNVGLFNDYMALRAQLGEVGTARSDLTRALKKKQMEWLKSRSKDWRGLGATVH